MRFLVDAQLPPVFARHLQRLGHEAEHVLAFGLEAGTDREIWDFAAARSAIIVTKDEDFRTMRAIQEAGPPIVWFRIGNTTTPNLIDAIDRVWPAVVEALERGEAIVEVS